MQLQEGHIQAGQERAITGQARQKAEGKVNNMEARQHYRGMVTNRAGQGTAVDKSKADW